MRSLRDRDFPRMSRRRSLWFDSLYANTGLPDHEIIILVMLRIIVAQGLVKGSSSAKVAMPLMVILFAGLAIYSITLPGALEGLKFYLKPDFTKLSFGAVVAAIGQVFLSIGVGPVASWVYGSYLKKDDDIPSDITKVVLMDTGFAFLAGLVIFPAAFAVGVQPDAGFGLLFKTMPSVFGTMPGGQFIDLLLLGNSRCRHHIRDCFYRIPSSSIMISSNGPEQRPGEGHLALHPYYLLAQSLLRAGLRALADIKWFGMICSPSSMWFPQTSSSFSPA